MYQLKKISRKHQLDTIIVYAGKENLVSSNFIYLTGLHIRNLVVLYHNTTLMFFYDYDLDPWNDYSRLFKPIRNKYASHIYDIKDIQSYIPKNPDTIYTLSNYKDAPFPFKSSIDHQLLDRLCGEARLRKSSIEITKITRATQYTSRAIRKLLRNFKKKKFKHCYQIIQYIKCYLGGIGIYHYAYEPICTVGRANQYLHSNIYSYRVRRGQLVLLDIGCRYHNYCSDITRTFPVDGVFTDTQKTIYDIILSINQFAIRNIKIGMLWKDLENKCLVKLYNALRKIHLVYRPNKTNKTNKINKSDKIAIAKLFMKHGLGHSIGLDVHDSDGIVDIQPNMVITIEPGIYFEKSQLRHPDISHHLWRMYAPTGGIRIEDVISIESNGNTTVLTSVPKSIEEIEKWMN